MKEITELDRLWSKVLAAQSAHVKAQKQYHIAVGNFQREVAKGRANAETVASSAGAQVGGLLTEEDLALLSSLQRGPAPSAAHFERTMFDAVSPDSMPPALLLRQAD